MSTTVKDRWRQSCMFVVAPIIHIFFIFFFFFFLGGGGVVCVSSCFCVFWFFVSFVVLQ